MSADQLTAEVLARTLREVRRTYQTLNEDLFGGRLRPITLDFGNQTSFLGRWSQNERTLTLNQVLAAGPWGTLVEVLKHEMAHQFVSEVLAISEEGPHGPTFRKVCEERGIDPRPSGSPSASVGYDTETTRVLERITKLLSLAASDNQHEAEAAMSMARRLMLKHNIQEAALGQSSYGYRYLGAPTLRRSAWRRTLANILTEYFFVEVIIVPTFLPAEGKTASVVEVCGSPANLEVAAYAHDFLERAAQELWRDHKRRQGRHAGAQNAFLLGVMTGFREKLAKDRSADRQTGLVWRGDPELSRYFRRRHPHIRTVSGRGVRVDEAFSAGQRAGHSLVLARGVSEGPSGRPPRLLGRGQGS